MRRLWHIFQNYLPRLDYEEGSGAEERFGYFLRFGTASLFRLTRPTAICPDCTNSSGESIQNGTVRSATKTADPKFNNTKCLLFFPGKRMPVICKILSTRMKRKNVCERIVFGKCERTPAALNKFRE